MTYSKTVKSFEDLLTSHENEYISLTNIARLMSDEPSWIIKIWLSNRNTLEFLGLWERLNNPGFKPLEFEGVKTEAGLNSFVLSPEKWIADTNAIGIVSKSGRTSGTFAHKEIATEFAAWLSPEFKLSLIQS